MSETPVAFARVCLCGVETAIAFAGEKWVFLVHFPGAEVTPVSAVLCWGQAVVLLVSTSPRCRAAVKSWGCAQGVDGLFVRLLSRPFGVVRIRWGFCAMRSLLLGFRRRVGGLDGVIPPARWRRGLGLERCCCQSADPLDAKHPQTTVLAEWVCTLADSLSGVAWWSHAKPLAGMRTRYVARNSPATT